MNESAARDDDLEPAKQRRESSVDPRPVAFLANPEDRVTHPPLLACLPSGRCLLQARLTLRRPSLVNGNSATLRDPSG